MKRRRIGCPVSSKQRQEKPPPDLFLLTIFIFLVLLAPNIFVYKAFSINNATRFVKDVSAEEVCAISNMSAKQAIPIALQNASVAAMEQAAGHFCISGVF